MAKARRVHSTPQARVEFDNRIKGDSAPAIKAYLTDWYDRILFYGSCLWGRDLGSGAGDKKLCELRYDGDHGYVAKVSHGFGDTYYARFDIIPRW